MSPYGSLMGSLMSVTTTVMHSPNVSFEITADTLTRADISTPYTAPDDMSVVDEVSMVRNGKEHETDVETVRLDQITHDSRCLRTKILALKCVFKISAKIHGHFSTKIDDYFSHIFILIVFFFQVDTIDINTVRHFFQRFGCGLGV